MQQCYWGEPIPAVFLDGTSESVPLHETQLPLTLPKLDDLTPTGMGEPPLSKVVPWIGCSKPSYGNSLCYYEAKGAGTRSLQEKYLNHSPKSSFKKNMERELSYTTWDMLDGECPISYSLGLQ